MPDLPLARQMARNRLIFGFVIGTIGLVAGTFGVRDLVADVRAANDQHSRSLLLLGLIGPAVLFGVAGMSLRLAYRNVFWRRFAANVAREKASISTAPSNER